MNARTAIPLLAALGLATVARADETVSGTPSQDNRARSFTRIAPNDQIPTVRAIAPMDGANVFFLNHRGQIGVAKFSPGLSQIGWDLYSEVKLNALPSLAIGPGYSLLAASPAELTQAFDTDQDAKLDFFQALVRDWPGRDQGVAITAGPIADPHGRVLFALAPHPPKPGDPAKARLMAWVPASGQSITVTESELPIESFALRRDGLLAARLSMPDYTDGYFLSLTRLPPPLADQPAAPPSPMPFTLPSFIVPAELTKRDRPAQLAFFEEDGIGKLLLNCPESRHLVEIVPEESGGIWQGAILLRGLAPKPLRALAEMAPGSLLGGGDEGFVPLSSLPDVHRIVRLALADDGILLEFNHPVDRYEAVKPENYSLKAIALGGGETALVADPVVEADGRVVLLRSQPVPPGHVLRVVCQNLPSETGEALLSPAAFYTIHAH